MEKYEFLGDKYNLDQISDEIDASLDKMIADWKALDDIISSLEEGFKEIGGNEEKPANDFIMSEYEAYGRMVAAKIARQQANQNTIIQSDNYTKFVKSVETSLKRNRKVLKAVSDIVESIAESQLSAKEALAALKPEHAYTRFAVRTLEKQKEYNNEHYYSHSSELEDSL